MASEPNTAAPPTASRIVQASSSNQFNAPRWVWSSSNNSHPSATLSVAPLARSGKAPLCPTHQRAKRAAASARPFALPPPRIGRSAPSLPCAVAPRYRARPRRGRSRTPHSVAAFTALRALPRSAHDSTQRRFQRSPPTSPGPCRKGRCPGKTWPAGVACHAACVQSPRHRCAASPPHDGRRGRFACHVTHIVRSFAGAPTPKRIRGKRTAHTC